MSATTAIKVTFIIFRIFITSTAAHAIAADIGRRQLLLLLTVVHIRKSFDSLFRSFPRPRRRRLDAESKLCEANFMIDRPELACFDTRRLFCGDLKTVNKPCLLTAVADVLN